MAPTSAESNGVKWWRSRYVQHLEAENAELRETIKRMLNPQWRYLLYGDHVSAIEDLQHKTPTDEPQRERVKLPGRRTWADIAAQATHAFSPQGLAEQRAKNHEQHLHAVRERIS